MFYKAGFWASGYRTQADPQNFAFQPSPEGPAGLRPNLILEVHQPYFNRPRVRGIKICQVADEKRSVTEPIHILTTNKQVSIYSWITRPVLVPEERKDESQGRSKEMTVAAARNLAKVWRG